jgi:hypothetical protein
MEPVSGSIDLILDIWSQKPGYCGLKGNGLSALTLYLV